MDRDLFLDLTAFCPEKYFIHRNVIKQTRLSFVDYEREIYSISNGISLSWWYKRDEHFKVEQEYGPSCFNKVCAWYYFLDRVDRPNIIYKKGAKIYRTQNGYFVDDGHRLAEVEGFAMPSGVDYTKILIKKAWVDHGRITRIDYEETI